MNRFQLPILILVSLSLCGSAYGQDSVKSEKKKWSIKAPFKGNKNPEDTAQGPSKLAFWKKDKNDTSGGPKKLSKMFDFLKKEVDTLKFHETFSLGIGTIIDSATNITESFEILRFFQENPMILEGRKIPVKLVSHPSQASLVVTGIIYHRYAKKCRDVVKNEKCDSYETESKYHIWKNGYKVSSVMDYQLYYPDRGDLNFLTDEVNLNYPLYDGSFRIIRFGLDKLFRSLYHYTGQDEKKLPSDPQVEKIMDCSMLNEFNYKQSKRRKLDKRDLAELLPGNVSNFIPTYDISSTGYIKNEKFTPLDDKSAKSLGLSLEDPIDIANMVNAIYRYVDYGEFRNLNSKFVPDQFKLELEPIIAPKSSWAGAPLVYLIAGDQFLTAGDWASAEMAYDACIYMSGEINSSMQVKQELRKLAVRGLLKIAAQKERKVSRQYLDLVINLSDNYLQSSTAKQRESEYRSDISQFQEICSDIDKKIDELKKQKLSGKVESLVETVGGALLEDKSMTKAGDTRFTKSGQSFNKGKSVMNEELAKIEMKDKLLVTIEANKIMEIESGSVSLSKMIWDILNSDDINKNVILYLKQFAADKPLTLQKVKLLESATPATSEARLNDLIKQLIEIEKGILKYEKQDQMIPVKF